MKKPPGPGAGGRRWNVATSVALPALSGTKELLIGTVETAQPGAGREPRR